MPDPREREETPHRPRQVILPGQRPFVGIERFVAAAPIDPSLDRFALEPLPPAESQGLGLVVADRWPIPPLGQLDDPVSLPDVWDCEPLKPSVYPNVYR